MLGKLSRVLGNVPEVSGTPPAAGALRPAARERFPSSGTLLRSLGNLPLHPEPRNLRLVGGRCRGNEASSPVRGALSRSPEPMVVSLETLQENDTACAEG